MSFGAIATTYDSYRPDWPADTAAWLTGTEPGGPLADRSNTAGLDVLDLGAGTGKLTRTLVDAGHRVIAVDPSEGMLAVLSESLPQVTALVGAAEEIGLEDHTVDVVTMAQAWHWVNQEAAGPEIARVLRPGGLLALGWHVRELGQPWMAELDQLTGNPRYQDGKRVSSQEREIELPAQFGLVQTAVFDYSLRLTPETLTALASSWSYVIVRPDRESVLAEVEALGHRVADADGFIEMPHLTHCYRAVVNQS